MTSAEAKNAAGFPPAWVQWVDVPRYIARRFNIGADLMDDVRWDLHSELLKSSPWLQHRIPGFRSGWGPPGAFMEQTWSPTDIRTLVMDWSKVDFDAVTGNVAGLDRRTGEPARIPVEVSWASIEEWFERIGNRKMFMRFRQAQAKARLTSSGSGQPPHADEPPGPPPNGLKVTFSEGALAGWFQLRAHTWPKGQPVPTEDQDLRAANAYFDRVPRDVFRQVRRDNTPDNWRKPGPGR